MHIPAQKRAEKGRTWFWLCQSNSFLPAALALTKTEIESSITLLGWANGFIPASIVTLSSICCCLTVSATALECWILSWLICASSFDPVLSISGEEANGDTKVAWLGVQREGKFGIDNIPISSDANLSDAMDCSSCEPGCCTTQSSVLKVQFQQSTILVFKIIVQAYHFIISNQN